MQGCVEMGVADAARKVVHSLSLLLKTWVHTPSKQIGSTFAEILTWYLGPGFIDVFFPLAFSVFCKFSALPTRFFIVKKRTNDIVCKSSFSKRKTTHPTQSPTLVQETWKVRLEGSCLPVKVQAPGSQLCRLSLQLHFWPQRNVARAEVLDLC